MTDPSTPTLWHPDYTKGWSVSGCIYKADCNQVGSATEAKCCAQYYGGQMGGLCTTIIAAATGSGGTKWYANYGTAWPTAGCKSYTPYPIYASTFYDTARKSSHHVSHCHWRVRDGLVCQLRHLVERRRLQEHPPAPQLCHLALRHQAGVLQGRIQRTDK